MRNQIFLENQVSEPGKNTKEIYKVKHLNFSYVCIAACTYIKNSNKRNAYN